MIPSTTQGEKKKSNKLLPQHIIHMHHLDQWWQTVDRVNLGIFVILIIAGLFLSFGASPPTAHYLHVDDLYFVRKHLLYLIPSTILLIGFSLINFRNMRYISILLYLSSIVLLGITFLAGVEVRGARRWLTFYHLTFQPSEFLKPSLIIACAWLISLGKESQGFPGITIAFLLYSIAAVFLALQPNIGTVILISLVFFLQLFVAGLSNFQAGCILVLSVIGLGSSYLNFSHVMTRINGFFIQGKVSTNSVTSLDQVTQSLQAFKNGGIVGRGPGEGSLKLFIPDIHSDFVLAVAGEEFGIVLCLPIIFAFGLIILRTVRRLLSETNLFVILASAGLAIELGLQALINVTSTLGLIPTSGMTLPFISYGGSSSIALSFGMGALLAFTRRTSKARDTK